MKKAFFLPMVALLALIACTKKEGSVGPNKEVGTKHPGQYTSADAAFETDMLAYNTLTASEKYSVWTNHLDKARDQFYDAHQNDKVELIDSLIAHLSSAVFNNASDDYAIFTSYYGPDWADTAARLFTPVEFYDLTTEPYRDTVGIVRTINEPDGHDLYAIPKCFCHVGNLGYACTKVVISIPPAIEYGTCELQSPACNEASWGCGFLWLYSCNGNHCSY